MGFSGGPSQVDSKLPENKLLGGCWGEVQIQPEFWRNFSSFPRTPLSSQVKRLSVSEFASISSGRTAANPLLGWLNLLWCSHIFLSQCAPVLPLLFIVAGCHPTTFSAFSAWAHRTQRWSVLHSWFSCVHGVPNCSPVPSCPNLRPRLRDLVVRGFSGLQHLLHAAHHQLLIQAAYWWLWDAALPVEASAARTPRQNQPLEYQLTLLSVLADSDGSPGVDETIGLAILSPCWLGADKIVMVCVGLKLEPLGGLLWALWDDSGFGSSCIFLWVGLVWWDAWKLCTRPTLVLVEL